MDSPSNELSSPVPRCVPHGCKAQELALLRKFCGSRHESLLFHIHNLRAC